MVDLKVVEDIDKVLVGGKEDKATVVSKQLLHPPLGNGGGRQGLLQEAGGLQGQPAERGLRYLGQL